MIHGCFGKAFLEGWCLVLLALAWFRLGIQRRLPAPCNLGGEASQGQKQTKNVQKKEGIKAKTFGVF